MNAERIDRQSLLERLTNRYSPPRFAFFEEVGNAVGFPSSRVDALAMAMWRSLGLELHGFEIKCSQGDWLREMKQPFKAEEIFSYCDRWWLVVSDRSIVKDGELPAPWGLLAPHADGLSVVVKAPKLSAQPVDRQFLASILRKAAAVENRPWQMIQRVKSDADEIRALISGMDSSLTRFERKLERLRYRIEDAKKELLQPASPVPNPEELEAR